MVSLHGKKILPASTVKNIQVILLRKIYIVRFQGLFQLVKCSRGLNSAKNRSHLGFQRGLAMHRDGPWDQWSAKHSLRAARRRCDVEDSPSWDIVSQV